MLEGNIFTSGSHGSGGGKRLGLLVVALGSVVAVSLAAGGIGVGSLLDTAVSGQGATASGAAESGTASPGFPSMAVGFVFLLVSMLVVILRM